MYNKNIRKRETQTNTLREMLKMTTTTTMEMYLESLEEMLAEVRTQMSEDMYSLLETLVVEQAQRTMFETEEVTERELEARWALEEMLETESLTEELEATVRWYL